jgi:hypothetical protein
MLTREDIGIWIDRGMQVERVKQVWLRYKTQSQLDHMKEHQQTRVIQSDLLPLGPPSVPVIERGSPCVTPVIIRTFRSDCTPHTVRH